jgi:uncharacterized membrane protein YphA (DoxX/SURF4 family)
VNVALWIVQVLLAALFVFAGVMKFVMPIEEMTGQMPIGLPGWFLRFIGAAELAGGLGLVLPGLLRIKTWLTPLAAWGLVIIMVGAVGITLMAGDMMSALMPFVVGLLLVFVAYGRSRVAPHGGSAEVRHAATPGRTRA